MNRSCLGMSSLSSSGSVTEAAGPLHPAMCAVGLDDGTGPSRREDIMDQINSRNAEAELSQVEAQLAPPKARLSDDSNGY